MNIHGLIRELSGPRPLCRVVDIVSKSLIWNQINRPTVFVVIDYNFREKFGTQHRVINWPGTARLSQGYASCRDAEPQYHQNINEKAGPKFVGMSDCP